MAEIINLNRVRKAKSKEAAVRQADENRIRFGRTKTEKQVAETVEDKLRRLLDGHKMDEPS